VPPSAFESVEVRDTGAAVALLGPSLLGLDREEFHVLHLGPRLGLIGHKIYAAGAKGSVDVPFRTLFHEALALGSQALILAHNHPDGDPRPSRADKAVTRRIAETARSLDILILDHLIFGRSDWISFRRLGLI
jgi:DNA repair protein RadC